MWTQNPQRVSKAVLLKLMEEKGITHKKTKTHPSQAIPSLQKLTLLTEVIDKKITIYICLILMLFSTSICYVSTVRQKSRLQG